MPRRIPEHRFRELVRVATEVFIAEGYRRTQMADVAEALGVAKGTIYLYVEGKEALFDVVVRSADRHGELKTPARLPVPTPEAGSTLRYIRERLARGQVLPELSAALGRRAVRDASAELEAILREIFALLARHRTGLKLLDRCAHDQPELAQVWFKGGRENLLALLVRYLEARIRQRKLRPVPDVAVAARFIVENLVFWAVHRYWDPSPQELDEKTAEETVVRLVRDALAPGA